MQEYATRVSIRKARSKEEAVLISKEFYCSFFPQHLVDSYIKSGQTFEEFYGKAIKNPSAQFDNNQEQENLKNNSIPVLIKPEAVFMLDALRFYVLREMGPIKFEKSCLIGRDSILHFYLKEILYPSSSNLLSAKNEGQDDPVYTFIFRISSMIAHPSFVFMVDNETNKLENLLRSHKKKMRDMVRSRLISLNFLREVENGNLPGFDPVEWHKFDKGWPLEAYNGVHIPSDNREAQKNIIALRFSS